LLAFEEKEPVAAHDEHQIEENATSPIEKSSKYFNQKLQG
jgi:hypothetical protein